MKLLVPTLVFLLLFGIYVASPNATPFDSRWTVFTALSILHQHNVDLNEYLPLLERDRFYAIECIGPGDRRLYPVHSASECAGGHFVNFYPVAVPLLAAPEVLVLEKTLQAAQPWLRPIAARMPTEARRRFLLADLAGSSALVELLIASLITALAGAVMYLVARQYLPVGLSVAAALLFGLATPAWSTASRALWQHGPSMLLLSLALLAAGRGPRFVAWAGLPLSIAFFVRPTNAVSILVFAAYVWFRHRDRFVAFLAAMAPASLLFCAMNFSTYGSPLSPYHAPSRPDGNSLALHANLLEALVGNLVNPNRGVFVFSPVYLMALAGLRRDARFPLSSWLAGAILLHWLLISSFVDWMSGHSYGPRYFSDPAVYFVYLLFPVLERIAIRGRRRVVLAVSFVVLSGWSVLVHQQGAMRWATMEWNVCPDNISIESPRRWDWRDPQFLRALRPGAPRCAPRTP